MELLSADYRDTRLVFAFGYALTKQGSSCTLIHGARQINREGSTLTHFAGHFYFTLMFADYST